MRMYAATAAILGAVSLGLAAAQTPPPKCLHGSAESGEQAARRHAALELARKIIATEAQANQQGHTYYAIADLPGLTSEVSGFKVQLSTDGGTYTFSMKDSMDPCKFALFADQEGVIYSGTPTK